MVFFPAQTRRINRLFSMRSAQQLVQAILTNAFCASRCLMKMDHSNIALTNLPVLPMRWMLPDDGEGLVIITYREISE